MEINKKMFKAFFVITAISLSFATVVPAAGLDDEKENQSIVLEGEKDLVYISSAEDFVRFAAECKIASYSLGRRFILTEDINLSNKKDVSVPYMDGCFDGNGHKITGVFINDDVSDAGLFRYIGERGTVENLKVTADITGGENTENVGIICGNNSGIIKDCEAWGSIDAHTAVGGVCGINNESGVVRTCINYSAVNSRFSAGGICGLNKGFITDCENNGLINKNDKVKKGNLDGDGKTVNISIPNAVTGFTADSRSNQSGGITGFNRGRVEYCINNGAVGNRELGNSSGGIAGRMSDKSTMTGNLNNANVYGAEGIGGIVGVLEPYEIPERGTRYRDELSDELDLLKSEIDALKDETSLLGDNLSDNIELISDEFKGLKDTVNNYADGYDADLSSSRAEIKNQADSLKDHVHDIDLDLKLEDVADSVEFIRSDMRSMSDCIKEMEEAAKGLSGEKKARLLDVVKKYKGLLSGIAGQLSSLDGSSEKISAIVRDIADSYGNSEMPKDIGETLDSLKDIPKDIKKRAGESLNDIRFYAKDCQSQLDNIADIMVSWPKEAKKLHHALKDARDDMEELYDASDELLDKLDARSDALRFELRARGDSISDTADTARNRLKTDRKAVSERIDAVKERMGSIRDTIDSLFDDVEEVIKEKSIYRDVSEEMGADVLYGQIYSCTNNGEVYAKKCAGGIVGEINTDAVRAYALENVIHIGQDIIDIRDEEEDEDNEIKPIIRYVQAKISSCRSSADIYADAGYVGGIAGRAVYGVIESCEAYGDFYSDDEKYVGGIAGFSDRLISGCYTLAGLRGNCYVGGVAGRGRDIKGCQAMSYMDMDAHYIKSTGAIAGLVKGNLSDNVYVDNGHGAVDGVTDYATCRGFEYKDFIRNGVPDEFVTFKVKFMDDDRIIWTETCKYGDSILSEAYPRLVPEIGQYVYWEDKGLSFVNRNMTIHSVRRYYVPSVSGKIKENNTVKPDLVIAGNFYPDTVLSVEAPTDEETKKIQDIKKKLAPDIHYVYDFAYHYEINQSEPFYNTMEFRVLNKSLMANQIVLLDDKMNPITELKDITNANSYLSLQAVAPESGYLIVITYVSKFTVAAVTVSVIVIIAVIIILTILFFRLKKDWKNRDNSHYREAAIRKSTMEFLSGFLSEDLIAASKKALEEMHRQNVAGESESDGEKANEEVNEKVNEEANEKADDEEADDEKADNQV